MAAHDDITPLGAAVLNLLAERPMHPYDMVQVLRERQEDLWVKTAPSSLYHQVDRLTGCGLVAVVGTEQAGRRPQRTTYRITDAGHQALRDWVSAHLRRVENAYPSFPLALGQLASLPPHQAAHDLRARLEHLDEHDRHLDDAVRSARAAGAQRIWLLAHEHALAQLRVEHQFVTALITDIDQEDLSWPHQ